MTTSTAPAIDRRKLWIELAIFLSVAWLPFMSSALISYLAPRDVDTSAFESHAVLQLCSFLASFPICAYIAWRSEGSLRVFGFVRSQVLFVILLSLAFLYGIRYANVLVYDVIRAVGPVETKTEGKQLLHIFARPKSPLEIGSLAVMCMLIGIFEEFTMRGFVLRRLDQLLGNQTWAMLASSGVWAAYHIYEGPLAAIRIFFMGLMFTAAFRFTRTLWVPILTHAMYDFIVYLRF